MGDFGRTSDGGIYAGSELGKEMESGTLQVPCDVCLPDAEELGEVPLVTVGDAAFPLKKTPYETGPWTKPHSAEEDFQ